MPIYIEDLKPSARNILQNISKYVHIQLLGNTINLQYTEESVARLARDLSDVANKGYDLSIVENARYENKI